MRDTPCPKHERQRSEIAAAVAALEKRRGKVQAIPTGLSADTNNGSWKHAGNAMLFSKDARAPAAKQKRASRPAKARQPRQQMPQKEAAPAPAPAQAPMPAPAAESAPATAQPRPAGSVAKPKLRAAARAKITPRPVTVAERLQSMQREAETLSRKTREITEIFDRLKRKREK